MVETAPDPRVASAATVVIADDDPGVRSALIALVGDHDGLRLVDAVADGDAAVDVCARARPDLAVVDVMMPGGGQQAVTGIRSASPDTLVVVYTARSDRHLHRQMTAAGAELVVVKGGTADLAEELVNLARRR